MSSRGNRRSLTLYVYNSAGQLLASSVSAYDNKERVYLPAVQGQNLELRVHGFRVATQQQYSAECGRRAMKVYWAYTWEDTARDDANGPPPSIELL